MKALGFGNKDLYFVRRCFGTRASDQGIPITDTAYALGHSTIETTVRNYVSVAKEISIMPIIKTKEQ